MGDQFYSNNFDDLLDDELDELIDLALRERARRHPGRNADGFMAGYELGRKHTQTASALVTADREREIRAEERRRDALLARRELSKWLDATTKWAVLLAELGNIAGLANNRIAADLRSGLRVGEGKLIGMFDVFHTAMFAVGQDVSEVKAVVNDYHAGVKTALVGLDNGELLREMVRRHAGGKVQDYIQTVIDAAGIGRERGMGDTEIYIARRGIELQDSGMKLSLAAVTIKKDTENSTDPLLQDVHKKISEEWKINRYGKRLSNLIRRYKKEQSEGDLSSKTFLRTV